MFFRLFKKKKYVHSQESRFIIIQSYFKNIHEYNNMLTKNLYQIKSEVNLTITKNKPIDTPLFNFLLVDDVNDEINTFRNNNKDLNIFLDNDDTKLYYLKDLIKQSDTILATIESHLKRHGAI